MDLVAIGEMVSNQKKVEAGLKEIARFRLEMSTATELASSDVSCKIQCPNQTGYTLYAESPHKSGQMTISFQDLADFFQYPDAWKQEEIKSYAKCVKLLNRFKFLVDV